MIIGRTAFALALVALVATACGSSSSPGGPHADASTKHDGSAQHIDAPVDVGTFDFLCGGGADCSLNDVCCTQPGQMPPFACVTPASCPAADKILCDGPDECGGTTPVCCGVDVPNGSGQFPNCGVTSIGTSCTSANACPTNVAQSCNQTSKVRLCHANTDCTEQNDNKCCTFTSNNASLTFCIDSLTAQLGGGTCM